MLAYAALTEALRVTVRPVWLESQSEPIAGKFTFAYFVDITNEGETEVQLLRRHWFIRDGAGHLEEVEGEGVVGKQPIIGPGETHHYNSFCVLRTFTGSMEGTFLMQRASGERLRIVIPHFDLVAMGG